MENLTFKGQITATSKKNSGDFKQEVITKTAYIKTDEFNAKKLMEFGLSQKYEYINIILPLEIFKKYIN